MVGRRSFDGGFVREYAMFPICSGIVAEAGGGDDCGFGVPELLLPPPAMQQSR